MAVIQMNAFGDWTHVAGDVGYVPIGGAMALRPDGSGVAVWHTSSSSRPWGDVVNGRLLAADGTPTGSEFRINSVTIGGGGDLVPIMLADGSFVVSWPVAHLAASGIVDVAIYTRHFQPDGTPLGPEVQVNSVFAKDGNFDATVLDDGDLVFTYGAGGKLYQERFDLVSGRSGAQLVGEYFDGWHVVGGSTGGGGYYAAWQNFAPRETRLQVFDAAGVPAGSQHVLPGFFVANGATLVDGSFVLLELSGTAPNRIERFSPAGEHIQSLPVFLQGGGASDVVAMPDGGFAVVIGSSPPDQVRGWPAPFVQRYDANGEPIDVPRQTLDPVVGTLLDTEALPNGELRLAYTPSGSGGSIDVFETSLATYVGTEADDVFVAGPLGVRAGVQVKGLGGADVLMVGSSYLDLTGVVLEGVEAIVTPETWAATRLVATQGNDNVGGHGRHDTMAYGLVRSDYAYEGTLAASTVSGADGTDTLYNVERIEFRDGTFVREVDSAAAAVLRLYEIGLDRAPDSYGFQAWIDAMGRGVNVFAKVAASAEFATRYGALDDEAFVAALYRDGFDRAPDPGGLDYWVGVLEQGGSRSHVLRGFTESTEAVANTRAIVEAGLWDLGADALSASSLFDAAFGRLPTRAEFFEAMAWRESSYDAFALPIHIAASAEFATLYASLDNRAFIDAMYQTALGRAPDAAGKSAWLTLMNRGLQRYEVLQRFSDSPEHQALFLPDVADGVRFSGEAPSVAEIPQLL